MGIKESAVGTGGSVSGGLSILGSGPVCHGACMGIASALSVVGITVSGMPLMFLQKVAIPFWILAVAILVLMLAYRKRMKFSKKIMLANTGFIISGTPLQAVSAFQVPLWIFGGALVAGSIGWAIYDRKFKHNIYKPSASVVRKRGVAKK